jgi:AcrR family transcriptional regulator
VAAAARELFHARGFDAVTTDEIAAAAGVAKGTLFLHAATKERLLLLAYEAELSRVAAQSVARVPDELSVPAALAHVFRHFFRLYEKAPDLAMRFVREVQFLDPSAAPGLERVRQAFLNDLAALLERRQRGGEIARDVDLQLAALDSFLVYYGVLTGWLSGHVPLAALRDRLLEDGLALLWRGLDRPLPAPSARRRAK